MSTSGYLVVRLPEWNEALPDGPILPPLNSIYYRGVDRCEWVDVFDEDFCAGRLPASLQAQVGELEARSAYKTGISLLPSFEQARQILAYSNRRQVRNEIIAIRLSSPHGAPTQLEPGPSIHWIGFDLFAESQWSLVARGLFTFPEYYANWTTRVNRYGLFDSSDPLVEYGLSYEDAVARGQSEEIAARDFLTIPVEVGLIDSGA